MYNQFLSTFRQIASSSTSASKCGFQKFVDFIINKHSSEAVSPQEEVLFLTFAFSKLMMDRVGGAVTLWLSLAVKISYTYERSSFGSCSIGTTL